MIFNLLKEYYIKLLDTSLFQYLNYYILFFVGFSIDQVLFIKLKLRQLYEKYCINNDFYIKNVKLIYHDINYQLINLNVNEYFQKNKNKIKTISSNLIKNIIDFYQINNIKINNDTRLLFYYQVNNKSYKIFYSYLNINNEINNIELFLPFYDKQYMNNLKENKRINDIIVYFKINCKDIEYLKINDKIYDNSIINEYLGPYYDFGFLLNTNFKVKWLLEDLLIDNFENIELKYLQYYFDEEDEMDLIEHIIKKNDKNELFLSNITKKLYFN